MSHTKVASLLQNLLYSLKMSHTKVASLFSFEARSLCFDSLGALSWFSTSVSVAHVRQHIIHQSIFNFICMFTIHGQPWHIGVRRFQTLSFECVLVHEGVAFLSVNAVLQFVVVPLLEGSAVFGICFRWTVMFQAMYERHPESCLLDLVDGACLDHVAKAFRSTMLTDVHPFPMIFTFVSITVWHQLDVQNTALCQFQVGGKHLCSDKVSASRTERFKIQSDINWSSIVYLNRLTWFWFLYFFLNVFPFSLPFYLA